jgi:MarR family transcriptional regulator, lower aerobic nicotinate degradation pathway regulator
VPRPHHSQPDGLEPTTGFLLVRIAEAIDRRFVDLLAERGSRPRQLHVLRYLDTRGPMSQKELAAGIGVDSGNLVETLDELQRDGLIRRDVDRSDRRRRHLQLTPSGTRRLRQGIAASERAEAEILGGLTRTELDALRATAQRVYEQLRGRSVRRSRARAERRPGQRDPKGKRGSDGTQTPIPGRSRPARSRQRS